MVKSIKYYLVDSENVNDNWLLLLDMVECIDKIIVFYTRNSPHMSYPSVVKLYQSDHPIKFEECYGGNNALDFQLVSYLGYLLNQKLEDTDFIILSNDTGFDPAVNFWKKRGMCVSRIDVNFCKLYLTKHKKDYLLTTEEIATDDTLNELSDKSLVNNFNKKEIDTFINCLGKDNLVSIHETLVHVYGQKQGQIIYKTIKDKSYPLVQAQYKRMDKIKLYSDIIFAHSDLNNPEQFVAFLEKYKSKTKNLNGIRSAIVKTYGEENGLKYYSLFKPYFKMISALK